MHQLRTNCLDQDLVDKSGVAVFLHRHFPLMMKLVPTARFKAFVDGFVDAYGEDDMMANFPHDFEPVEVDLNDPCRGEGYVRVVYHRPHCHEVVYQCPALACRDASSIVIEEYARKYSLPIVKQCDGTIAALHDLSKPSNASEGAHSGTER